MFVGSSGVFFARMLVDGILSIISAVWLPAVLTWMIFVAYLEVKLKFNIRYMVFYFEAWGVP